MSHVPLLAACPKEKVIRYMREVYHQPHPDVCDMWSCMLCFCREPATLQQGQSQDSPEREVSDLFQEKVQLLSVGRQTFGPKVPQLVAKQERKVRSPTTHP